MNGQHVSPSIDDSVRIEHRNDFEDKLVSERLSFRTQQVLQHSWTDSQQEET